MAEMMHTEIVQYLKLGLFVDTALPSPQCEEPIDVSFMHRSFCAAGLPLRRPKNVLDPYAREFIPIKPLAATGSGGPGSYAGHSRFPLRHPGRPASTGGSGL